MTLFIIPPFLPFVKYRGHIRDKLRIHWTSLKWKGGAHMPFEERGSTLQPPHHVVLEDRKKLTVSGVEEVDSFDENTIILRAPLGLLTVRGQGLHIEKLSLDGGDLQVQGSIDSLVYEDVSRDGGGFFSRLFR